MDEGSPHLFDVFESELEEAAISAAGADDVGVGRVEAGGHDVGGVTTVATTGRLFDHGRVSKKTHEAVVARGDEIFARFATVDVVDVRPVGSLGPNTHHREAERNRPRVPRGVALTGYHLDGMDITGYKHSRLG